MQRQFQYHQEIGSIVIVGGGPVGNFCAVIAGLLGIKTYVYQKRPTYTRQINIKIEKGFFKSIADFVEDVSWVPDIFFTNLEEIAQTRKYKIQLKKLELLMKEKAESLGVAYIVGAQIKSFSQAQRYHLHENPIILDCSGRRSILRDAYFGKQEENMKINKLAQAMHINFQAQITSNMFDMIYPVIKNNPDLKLGQIVTSQSKKSDNEKLVHITVPLFITEKLGQIFDNLYPQINKKPLNPFMQRKSDLEIPYDIEFPVYSLFCALVMEGWKIQWDSVQIKKISITCGYALGRSHGRYICLGDSAAHFAYFRSLNFGLQTAFQFFKSLVSYPHLHFKRRGEMNQSKILKDVYMRNLHLWPVSAKYGPSMDSYLIKTHVLAWNTFCYNNVNKTTKVLGLIPKAKQSAADSSFDKFQQKFKQKRWSETLKEFQQKRMSKIKAQMLSNKQKSYTVEIASYMIWANKLSPIKLSETISYMKKGFFLGQQDFKYFVNTLKHLKSVFGDKDKLKHALTVQMQTLEGRYGGNLAKKLPLLWELFQKIRILITKDIQTEQFMERLSILVALYKYQEGQQINKTADLFMHCLSIFIETAFSQQPKFYEKEINLREVRHPISTHQMKEHKETRKIKLAHSLT